MTVDLPRPPTGPMPFAAPADFVGGVRPPAPDPERGLWFIFRRDRLLTEGGSPRSDVPDDPRAWPQPAAARLPRVATPAVLGLRPRATLYLGRLGSEHCYAASVEEQTAAPPGFAWYGLRAVFTVLDDTAFALAGRALQLVEWDLSHRFCGRCATPTTARETERSRACPHCGLVAFPRLAPAVMALVCRPPRELLLARSARFPEGMYSALAGFVEPGETLEQAVDRELLEEVGVRVDNLRYFASQPWPFPHSLMIAFVADWVGGDLCIDGEEIAAADWFDVASLPRLPSPISIAWRLISTVADEMSGSAR